MEGVYERFGEVLKDMLLKMDIKEKMDIYYGGYMDVLEQIGE